MKLIDCSAVLHLSVSAVFVSSSLALLAPVHRLGPTYGEVRNPWASHEIGESSRHPDHHIIEIGESSRPPHHIIQIDEPSISRTGRTRHERTSESHHSSPSSSHPDVHSGHIASAHRHLDLAGRRLDTMQDGKHAFFSDGVYQLNIAREHFAAAKRYANERAEALRQQREEPDDRLRLAHANTARARLGQIHYETALGGLAVHGSFKQGALAAILAQFGNIESTGLAVGHAAAAAAHFAAHGLQTSVKAAKECVGAACRHAQVAIDKVGQCVGEMCRKVSQATKALIHRRKETRHGGETDAV